MAGGTTRNRLRRHLPAVPGLVPAGSSGVGTDVLAGATLAALGIPAVLGYAKIAGMPVVTGLYTILFPMAAFALLGSSRHLVVGADSATAAILASGLASLAAAGSAAYVRLAGLAALLTGGLLLLAWLIRLGFLADFLSRTVLVGFLTGVGIQVACAQLPDMLGVSATGASTPAKLLGTLRQIPNAHPLTAAISLVVIVGVVGAGRLSSRIPAALVGVVGAIVVSQAADLAAHGVAVLGAVPRGLPRLVLPRIGGADTARLLGTSLSMAVVVLAQSSATARAYAARYDEDFSANRDLAGLGAANLVAGLTGSFVVNGSPTKTQIVDSAGGRSQLAQLTTCAVVLVVVLALTAPLAYLPVAVLATVVFLIGLELVDVRGMRDILAVRRAEFGVALLTAAAVVLLGVEQGVAIAVVASMVDHLRHSYDPHSSVLRKSGSGHWQAVPVTAGARTEDGLVVYRFGSSLYFANASRLFADLVALTAGEQPPAWFCLDGAAIGDVDYSASLVLARAGERLRGRGTRLVLSNIIEPVRDQLDHYGLSEAFGPGAYFRTSGEVLEAFHDGRPAASRDR